MIHCAFKNECVMLTQAIEQRRITWASEQSFFKQYAKPMMAFVEAFVIAITPFAAFMILVGGHGLAIKYMLTLAWVAMWTPIMAICNMSSIFLQQTTWLHRSRPEWIRWPCPRSRAPGQPSPIGLLSGAWLPLLYRPSPQWWSSAPQLPLPKWLLAPRRLKVMQNWLRPI